MTGKPRLTPLDAIVGAHAKRLREGRKLTQAQVAEAMGCNSNQISMLETGDRAWSVYWINLYANFFDIHPSEMLGGGILSDEDKRAVRLIRALKETEEKLGSQPPNESKPKT